ncbi:hypothetical protein WJX73_005350 [Symbiochloris irregularis]|uniref:Proteasome assembly chaperone 2 n=1 Tax=Symbiochloris irregularis TaxID=706552 RepID=A0AAW1NZJ7_9CHLO
MQMLPREAKQLMHGKFVLLPTTGIGSLAQLAVDLLVSTLRLSRLAVLHSEQLLPCVGNDAYSRQKGTLCSELELYGSTTSEFICLQQRAPAATGRQQAFAEELCDFLQHLQPRQVLILGSLNAALRQDQHLGGPQVHILSTAQDTEGLLKAISLKQLEAAFLEANKTSEQLLPPWPLWTLCSSHGLATVMLAAFCTEAVDAAEVESLAQKAIEAVHSLGCKLPDSVPCKDRAAEWLVPPSWAHLQGPSRPELLY